MPRNKTPHTACFRGKRVRVKLSSGEIFFDRFHDRTSRHVMFQSGRIVTRGDIVSFSQVKNHLLRPGAEGEDDKPHKK